MAKSSPSSRQAHSTSLSNPNDEERRRRRHAERAGSVVHTQPPHHLITFKFSTKVSFQIKQKKKKERPVRVA